MWTIRFSVLLHSLLVYVQLGSRQLIELEHDTCERQPRRTAGVCTHIVYTRDSSLYVRANSCVNRLKAGGVGDSASWMLSCDQRRSDTSDVIYINT